MANKKNKKKNDYNFVPQPKKNAVKADEVVVEEGVEAKAVAEVKPVKAEAQTKKPAKRKEKKPSRVVKSVKEIGSELKKVSWPTFSKVAKQTGIVIAVVVFFTLVLFGIDRLASLLYTLLSKTIAKG